jgi:excisionase family DNA binding protein
LYKLGKHLSYMAATYTVKQVAQILGYSTNSIYTFLKEKRIKGVRVGKGRFRIPQGELDRLLQTHGATKVLSPTSYGLPFQPVPGVTQALPSGVIEAPRSTIVTPSFVSNPLGRVEVPSLFDWFVGIGSIVLGLAMFLFSRVYEEFSFEQFLPLMPAIRMTLIAGGFGLLLTDIVSRKLSIWHKVFHWALVFAYAFYTFVLLRTGNWEGVVIFGTLMATLLFTFFTGVGGFAGFAIYVVGFLVLLPMVVVFSPATASLTPFIAAVPLPTIFLAYVWIAIVGVAAFVIWIGYMRDRRVFWIGMLGVSVLLVLLSIHYANNLAWGRALFILITGILSLFVPVWQSLTFAHKRDRAFIFGAFGTLLVLYIIVVGILRVMQTNVMDYASRELANKVSYGKSLLESTIMSTKTSLSSAASNTLLIDAIQSDADDDLKDVVKALFEGNTVMRRVMLIGADGTVLTTYPYAVADTSNYSQSDYVIQATTTRRTVMAEVLDGSGEVKRKSIVIASPVVNKKNVVVGIIAGILDMETLGNKLQQIVSSTTGEYFVVIDASGKRIIHKDADQIGGAVDEKDPIRLAFTGGRGVAEWYGIDGSRTLVAYDSVDTDANWAIAVKAPIVEILQATNAATITIFTVIILSIFIVGLFLLSHKTKVTVTDAIVLPSSSSSSHEEQVGKTLGSIAKQKRRSPTSSTRPPARQGLRGVREDTS